MRRILLLLVGVLLAVAPAQAQTVEVAGSTLAIGTSPTSPSGTSVRLDNLGTSGGTLVLLTDTDGDVFERVLAKSDLPAVVGYTDEAETWSLLQTFTSGLTSNGLLTVGGANDLLLGTGGMRVASGSILLRNIADSATIASFGDSAIALNQPTTITGNSSVTGTWGVSGLSTLTGGFTAGASSSVNAALTVTGLTTAALIKTTGVYGVASPFTVYATDATTPRLQVADGGPVLLTDTGTDSYLRVAATGATSGTRQWRSGIVNGNYRIDGGNDAANTWSILAQGTQTAGVPNGWFWGAGVSDVNPLLSYQTKLGTDIYKYLSLSAAELKVGTIVAQDYIATIAGRVLVLPTTKLTSDLGDGVSDTTIVVEHNEMANGDQVLMEAAGKFEVLRIDSGPTGTGGGDSVAFIGDGSAAATSVTIPTHTTGDTLVIIAFRIGSNSPPTATTGSSGGGTWTNLCNGGDNNTGYRVAYMTATSAAETSGTWANATHMHAFVLQGVTAVSTCTTLSGAATTTLSYPAMTLADADGSSYVLRAGITNQTSDTSGAMTGYTLLENQTGSSRNSSSFRSNAGQTSVTQFDVTGLTSGNTRGIGLELQGTTTPATGPYSYTVTRDRDGTGRNLWYKGDALANTGNVGDGFWDIYSIQSVKGGTEAGPTMCANERTSTTYNAWSPRFCAGNLNGLYGNSATDLYGVAFGDYTDVWGQIDATNGLRFFEGGSNQKLRIDPTGYVLIGTSGSGQANTYIDNTSLKLRRGTVDYVTLASTGLTLTDGTNTRVQLDATDGLVLGRTASGNGNVWADTSGNIHLRSGTTQRISLAAANGSIAVKDSAGDSRVLIDSNGLTLGLTATGNGNIHMDTSGNAYWRVGTTNKITMAASTGDLSLLGALTIGTSGSLSSGATAYATGTGYWLDYNAGTPRFYIGNGSSSTSEYLTWSGTALSVSGSLRALSDLVLGGSANITKGSGALTISNTSTGQNMTLAAGGGAGTLIVTAGGFQIGGGTGVSATKTVRDSAGTGTCTLIFTYGVLTGGSC